MKGLIFMFIVATTIILCRSIPDDIDDFNRISSSLPQPPQSGGLGVRFIDEKHTREFEMQEPLLNSSPFLPQFVHQGNNLFFKPQVLFGSIIKNDPYISHKPEIKEEKELVVSDNMPPSYETISKEDESESASVEEIAIKKLPVIPEAPILPPLIMPALPQVVVEEPEVIIENSDEKIIIDEEHIIIPEPPTRTPMNLPKLPVQIFTNKLVENQAFIRPLLTRIPLNIPFKRPINTEIPFREEVISTQFLPSVTVSKFPLNKSNRRFLINPNGRLSKMLTERLRIEQEKSVDCANDIVLERISPNIVINRETIDGVPVSTLEFQ